MVVELYENPLNITWNITETQVNNHRNLSEIWRRIKWTFTLCSEKYHRKQTNNATVDKRHYQRTSEIKREITIMEMVIKSCAKDTLRLDTKDHVN